VHVAEPAAVVAQSPFQRPTLEPVSAVALSVTIAVLPKPNRQVAPQSIPVFGASDLTIPEPKPNFNTFKSGSSAGWANGTTVINKTATLIVISKHTRRFRFESAKRVNLVVAMRNLLFSSGVSWSS